MLRITDILDKTQSYLSPDDQEMIEKAYVFSATVHQGQMRLSGEPYLTHPMEVAGMLADMKLDAATIITGLLHDTVEDTLTTIEQIEAAFGKDVAFLVDGLTKISKITFGSQEERQAENFRKMILAMSADLRILIVRLADRMHNMRTLNYHPPEKQRYIATETLELYAPLANRLGINWMKVELEDLSFLYLDSDAYYDISRRIDKKREQREQYTEEVRGIIAKEIAKYGLHGEVEGRAKHFYSIYAKMKNQRIDFDEVYDLIAFRIILDTDKDKECYEALSIVHALWKPVPGRFKDRIAMPKANGYQSLHTTVIGPYGERVEIQIRTRQMHEWAEEGIAAHWRYKERRSDLRSDDQQIMKLRELLEVQQEVQNPREFMANLKLALFPDEVYVFTPNGDVKSFPKGATPLDFAYSIHTDVGNQCIGARVNRSIVPLKYELQNGDTVEIITQAGHHPGKDWLKWAVTSRARAKIKNWIKTEERKRSIEIGREILEREFKKQNIKLSQFLKSEDIKSIYEEQNISTADDLMALIGYGRISAKHIINRLLPETVAKVEETALDKPRKKTKSAASVGISLTGIEDVLVKFAHCCDPIPGDEIVGYISRGRGITIHTAQCPNLQELDPDRFVEVSWNIKDKQTYPVDMLVICQDKKGVIAEVSSVISALDINISHAEVETTQDLRAICNFRIDVHDLQEFNRVAAAIKKVKCVLSIERMKKT
ncbi:MAG TPA: bifunctional (p)ppGpp synthetase/guanosine-3',5'-bis(diphosphate) 3'-pyrophosphohydrolase [Syntrophales bacterium]|nr:bifunctional (p)ppGpp synthetase/guanosine-3',5'-bis(diphosphate) 3'-pyrophosphohydrolase [Syntrophales bacterium]HPC32778.1 bifunctional (p)ppGpp synthetase/guanosine-3',5'-bis(diphosphate) 3'-pyrophosphohydrolase [Syntrophales bacterium]HRU88808.1 bifunctional (p)ppGpp synthetase/guanosine-3',5'-bis(diphosphate) 3'-pyrophosphohydrolase [Syntrophales bacterium]